MPEPATITVTSATQTEEQVRAALEPPAEPATEPAAPVEVVEQEADSPKTDAEVSEAARTLRRSRSEKKVLKEIALRKQAEERSFRLEQELAAARQRPPVAAPPSALPADAAPAAVPLAAPTFTFATFDEYQAKHPDADYDAYQDARADARDAWREGVKRANAAHEAQQRAIVANRRAETQAAADYETHKEAFVAQHPDYDDVLNRVQLPAVLDARGQKVDAPVVGPFRDLLLRAGKDAPQILYYLGQHPDEAERVFAAPNPAGLIATFTEMKLKAVGLSSGRPTPVAAARPSRPVTDAPAPLSAVPGGNHHTPTLTQLADGDDDADAYIARRRQDLKRMQG